PTTLDTTVSAAITLNAVSADNIVNATEAAGMVAISGTVGGDVADGDTVTLTINGNSYTGQASAGAFSIAVAGAHLAAEPDSSVHASVTTIDDAGNTATTTADHAYSVANRA